MTEFSAYLLYLIMAIILLWMWQRVRGKSVEDIVQESADHHHQLIALFEVHPQGGSWREFESWVEDGSDCTTTSRGT